MLDKKRAAWRDKSPEAAYRATNRRTAKGILPRAGLNCQPGDWRND